MKKNLLLNIMLLAFCAFFVIGCASKVQMEIMRPAEINLKNVKVIGIGNVTGSSSSAHKNTLSTKLSEGLLNCGYFEKVVDRQYMSTLEAEHNLSLNNMTDEEFALSIGKYIGASNLVFAISSESYTESTDKSSYTNSKTGKITSTYYRKGDFKLTVNYKVINAETTELIAAKSITASKKKSLSSSLGYPGPIDKEALFAEALNEVVTNFMAVIAPHKVMVSVKLEEDKLLPKADTIINFMKAGATDDALELLFDAAQADYEKTEVKAKALYNYGIVVSLIGNYETGSDYLKQALKLVPSKKLYVEGVQFATKEAENAAKLEEQLK